MNKIQKPQKKTIGEMTKTRAQWEFDTSTKVKAGKKGTGAYNRSKFKAMEDLENE